MMLPSGTIVEALAIEFTEGMVRPLPSLFKTIPSVFDIL
jgi:hypothetical protein